MLTDNHDADLMRLLERAREGGSSEREFFFEIIRSMLKRYLPVPVPVHLQSRLSSSDVVNATVLKVHRDLPSFDGNSVEQFKAWVETIARRTALDMIDIERRRPTDPIPSGFEPAVECAPDDEAAGRESLVGRLAALQKLSATDREIIELRNFNQLSFEEIALLRGDEEGTVRRAHARAVERWKKMP